MGLNTPDEILDAFSNVFKPKTDENDALGALAGLFSQRTEQSTESPKNTDLFEFDREKYFSENTVDSSALSDNDLITVSLKQKDCYKAAFVSLGDLKKFLKT